MAIIADSHPVHCCKAKRSDVRDDANENCTRVKVYRWYVGCDKIELYDFVLKTLFLQRQKKTKLSTIALLYYFFGITVTIYYSYFPLMVTRSQEVNVGGKKVSPWRWCTSNLSVKTCITWDKNIQYTANSWGSFLCCFTMMYERTVICNLSFFYFTNKNGFNIDISMFETF